MKKAVDLVKKIKENLSDNWQLHLEEANLHTQFSPIYKLGYSQKISNSIVAFVIMSYDNDSPWIEPRKDRYDNKISILSGLGIEYENKIFKDILNYENDDVQRSVLAYLLNQTDARWREILSLLDYSDKMLIFANERTSEKRKTGSKLTSENNVEDVYEYLDEGAIAKINKEKGDLLTKAIEAREKAEELLKKLENDFQKVDSATQGDFNFTFSDPKKYNPLSWEQRVRKRKFESLK